MNDNECMSFNPTHHQFTGHDDGSSDDAERYENNPLLKSCGFMANQESIV